MHDSAAILSMALSGSGAKLARDYERACARGEQLSKTMTPTEFADLVRFLHDAEGFFDWWTSIVLPRNLDAAKISDLSAQILKLISEWDRAWLDCAAAWEFAITRLQASAAMLTPVATKRERPRGVACR